MPKPGEILFGPGPNDVRLDPRWSIYNDPPNASARLSSWRRFRAIKTGSRVRLHDGTLVKVIAKKNNGRVRIEFENGRREWRKAKNVNLLGHPLEELAQEG